MESALASARLRPTIVVLPTSRVPDPAAVRLLARIDEAKAISRLTLRFAADEKFAGRPAS